MRLNKEIDPATGRPSRAQYRALLETNRATMERTRGEVPRYVERRYLSSFKRELERFHDLDSTPVDGYAGAAMNYFGLNEHDLPEELIREIEMAMHEAAREALVQLMTEHAQKIAAVVPGLWSLRS